MPGVYGPTDEAPKKQYSERAGSACLALGSILAVVGVALLFSFSVFSLFGLGFLIAGIPIARWGWDVVRDYRSDPVTSDVITAPEAPGEAPAAVVKVAGLSQGTKVSLAVFGAVSVAIVLSGVSFAVGRSTAHPASKTCTAWSTQLSGKYQYQHCTSWR